MSLVLDQRGRSSGRLRRLFFTAAAGVAALGRRIADWINAEIDRRHTMQLLALDAHELKDVGISRADVEGALLAPAGTRPSRVLAERQRDRREAARLAADERRQDAARR